MVIYGEYLFLENFLAGWFLLALTGKFCGPAAGGARAARGRSAPGGRGRRRMGPRRQGGRLGLGAAACGLYSFTLFLEPMPWLLSFALKLVFAWFLTAFCFGGSAAGYRSSAERDPLKKPEGPCRKVPEWLLGAPVHFAVFLLVSFALGGLVLGVLFLCDAPGLTYDGGFYLGPLAYGKAAVSLGISCVALWAFACYLEQRRVSRARYCRVEVEAFGRVLQLRGFLDTGNLLRDPLTGRPVYLLAAEAAEELLQNRGGDLCYPIPYCAAGCARGRLEGFRPDAVRLFQGEKEEEKGCPVQAVLAKAPGRLPKGCQILVALGPEFIANKRCD